jgi:hypothetical protein
MSSSLVSYERRFRNAIERGEPVCFWRTDPFRPGNRPGRVLFITKDRDKRVAAVPCVKDLQADGLPASGEHRGSPFFTPTP